MEYVSKACPFCGGTQINEYGGAYVCAYCLQPFDVSNGNLSEGYNKLESLNFVGAARFFASKTDSVGAEAYYGLFLAEHKIAENRTKKDFKPVIYSYCPDSFAEDKDYTALLSLAAGNRALFNKLEKLEEVRAATLASSPAYDVIVFYDDGAEKASGEFCSELVSRGFSVLKTNVGESVSIGALRGAAAAYAFVSGLSSVEKLAQSKAARNFYYTENARTRASGIGKRPVKLVSGIEVPDILISSMLDYLEAVPEISASAEIRRLGALTKNKSYSVSADLFKKGERSVNSAIKVRDGYFVAEIKNEAADLERLMGRISAGDFIKARELAAKLKSGGYKSSKFYWLEFLACAGAENDDKLIGGVSESFFNPESLSACENALYNAANYDEAKPYISVLVKTALRLIDRKKSQTAITVIDCAFSYDYADEFAQKLFDRTDAAKSMLAPFDYYALTKKILEKLSPDYSINALAKLIETLDYALLCGDFARADDIAESLLYEYGASSELYARKTLCLNRVKNFDELYASDYPRLGESYVGYIALLPKNKAATEIRRAFDALTANAQKRGYENCSSAIDEVLALDKSGLTHTAVFSDKDYCTAGEIALKGEFFEEAGIYFADAIERNINCYAGYWGALKAKLNCKNERKLEESDSAIEEAGNYYVNAYNSAYGRDDAFIKRMEKVRKNRSEMEKADGCVFRKSDFIISGSTAVRYIGSGTENVYVGGGIKKIGAGAFRGSDAKKISLSPSVTSIGNCAFAFSDLKSITVTQSVNEVGDNPFCGCNDFCEINGKSGLIKAGGGVYFAGRLIACLPKLAGEKFEVEKGVSAIGAKAFYGIKNMKATLPDSLARISPCAFYDCTGMEIKGRVPECKPSITGEGAFGGGVLISGRIADGGDARWESLYGDYSNNMAAGGDVLGDGKVQYKSVCSEGGKISGGFLVKNGKIIYASGEYLYIADILNAVSPVKIALGGEIASTGVLYKDYIIQPIKYGDGSRLIYINQNGKIESYIDIVEITRPLCLYDGTLLCIGGSEANIVNLNSGAVKKCVLPEKITCVPCGAAGKFVVAGENCIYTLDKSLAVNVVHSFKGADYAKGVGKICRGRIVGCADIAYWIERDDSNIYLGAYDGNSVTMRNIPRRIADFMQTQPIFYNGEFYCGATKAVISAKADCNSAEWNFKVNEPVSGKYAEIAVIGGEAYVNYMDGEYGNLRLRALYNGFALLTDVVKGGIYVARI